MTKKIFISLRTQYSNMGDLLINKALLEELIQIGNVHVDLGGVPKFYQKLILKDISKIEKYNRLEFYIMITLNSILRVIDKRQVFLFLKPGGYMAVNSFMAGLRRFLQGSFLYALNYVGIVIIRAPSSQQNSNGVYNMIDKYRLRPINIQLIRDKNSYNEVHALNLDCVRSYDMASYYFNSKKKSIFRIDNNNKSKRSGAAISFRKTRNKQDEVMYNKFVNNIAEEIPDIRFVSQVFYDNNINQYFCEELNSKLTKYDGTEKSILAVMSIYQRSEYVLSNRLHVLMLALLAGAIPIGIVGDNDDKIIGYFESLNLKKYLIPLNSIESLDFNTLSEEWTSDYFELVKTQGELLHLQIQESMK